MKVTIAAGGTGGHVFPAVAVATALRKRGDEVQWIGRPSSLEESEAKKLGAAFEPIPLQGLKRKWTWENARAVARFIKGRTLVKGAVRKFQPDVVFALGSYVGAPAISAALATRTPVAVHEQNVVPGLVVRRYANKVDRILLTKPLVGKEIGKGNARVVGMPLRPGILKERTDGDYRDLGLDPGKKTFLIFGGSQGARTFCGLGLELAHRWKTERSDWQILLQTGVANLAWTESHESEGNIVPVGNVKEMGKAYACADVILARSGAASCAELEAVGKPTILVPFPYATADHQRLNAEEFVQGRPGCWIAQKDLSLDKLLEAFERIEGKAIEPLGEKAAFEPVERIVRALDEVAEGGIKNGRIDDEPNR